MPPTVGSNFGSRFRKTDRLRKRKEYLKVQRQGRRVHLRDLVVLILPQRGRQRMGVTVSTKVGGAVTRNRIKRLLREVWRRDRGLLPDGIEIVFVAKRRASSTTFSSLRSQLRELGRRIG
jgi:ribonuclease P protein component